MSIKSIKSNKVYADLMKNREAKRKATETQAVEVTIEGRSGLYLMDMEHKEFRNTYQQEDKIPFDTDEAILITSFTCPNCGKLINKPRYVESGIYSFKEHDYVYGKTVLSCPLCNVSFNNDLLKAIGVIVI